ncbi:restriction endonuclease [Aquisalibacillus elongatus]|uniref:Restriction system protein n=1 Tax=Aquisalibacillus elongatus TaxID=485577 RepID=A0A3N5C731_9BACI|nr:restriction endonuclease [Aquisalibacillus elongatus]RPF55272.1 restriction system protein [Aquisalibacillus elongatus]
MASRKSAAKREQEFKSALKMLLSVGLFAIVFFMTSDFLLAFIFGLIGLVATMGFLEFRKINYNKKIKSSKISDIDKMSGVQFEYFLKLLFKHQGYKVSETNTTGDYGADLILTKEQQKIIVQAKRYKSRVGIKAVQETVSAIPYYNGTEGWVVTNNEFTDAAINLAKTNNVRLIERKELMEMILRLNEEQPDQLVNQTQQEDLKEKCKRCGSELVLRNSKRGQFYGCSNFPKCRYTQGVSG